MICSGFPCPFFHELGYSGMKNIVLRLIGLPVTVELSLEVKMALTHNTDNYLHKPFV
jgi:hypothetical protein